MRLFGALSPAYIKDTPYISEKLPNLNTWSTPVSVCVTCGHHLRLWLHHFSVTNSASPTARHQLQIVIGNSCLKRSYIDLLLNRTCWQSWPEHQRVPSVWTSWPYDRLRRSPPSALRHRVPPVYVPSSHVPLDEACSAVAQLPPSPGVWACVHPARDDFGTARTADLSI